MANSANLDLGFQSCVGSGLVYRAMFTGNSTKARELDCNTFTSYSNRGHKELNSEIINIS